MDETGGGKLVPLPPAGSEITPAVENSFILVDAREQTLTFHTLKNPEMDRARLTVTTGPDRGRVFELAEEMVNIGRDPQNEIALTDRQVAEHQATLMSRNGRYAIYVLQQDSVEVDGSVVPAEQWVWLPETARIKLSAYTGLRFQYEGSRKAGNGAPAAKKPKADKPEKPDPPPKARSGKGQAGKAPPKERRVARFITDQTGDALVRLGEDGHLPELSLSDAPTKKVVREKTSSEGSFPLAYVALAGSVLLSLVLLLVPSDPGVSTESERARARQEITEFYGDPNEEPTRWQKQLREARLAHSSGDDQAERRAYLEVLEMLNAEEYNRPGAPSHIALTGDRTRDETLRELISILLSR